MGMVGIVGLSFIMLFFAGITQDSFAGKDENMIHVTVKDSGGNNVASVKCQVIFPSFPPLGALSNGGGLVRISFPDTWDPVSVQCDSDDDNGVDTDVNEGSSIPITKKMTRLTFTIL